MDSSWHHTIIAFEQWLKTRSNDIDTALFVFIYFGLFITAFLYIAHPHDEEND